MKTEENITWDERRAATESMLSRLAPITEDFLRQMDSQKGVYILVYAGVELDANLWGEADQKIVYVGRSKFNSSRHFMDGMTGTSTIRRSL
ncbi:MAG: hypothetical protein RR332_03625, partial [Clostridiales bacterium]